MIRGFSKGQRIVGVCLTIGALAAQDRLVQTANMLRDGDDSWDIAARCDPMVTGIRAIACEGFSTLRLRAIFRPLQNFLHAEVGWCEFPDVASSLQIVSVHNDVRGSRY